MPDSGTDVTNAAFAGWLIAIALAGFLVSWLSTDVGRLARSLYIGVLTAATAALVVSYLAWSGTGGAFWTHHWAWGIVGGAASGAILAALVRRRSHGAEPHPMGAVAVAWEGLVYGIAEGLLLSVLPVIVAWQWWDSRGWSDGWQAVGGVALALLVSVAAIVVHHLGYRSFRSSRILQPILGCTILSVAYALSGNPFAAIGGHVVLHVAMLRAGNELPPERVPSEAPGAVPHRRGALPAG